MKEKIKNIFITLIYFIITIAFLGSIGVWLPVFLDDYNLNYISNETFSAIASNTITYSLSIFLVSIIDRILRLFINTSPYHNNVLEFFSILILVIITAFTVYLTLKDIKQSLYISAIWKSLIVTMIAWLYWLYVKFISNRGNSFDSIGGQM